MLAFSAVQLAFTLGSNSSFPTEMYLLGKSKPCLGAERAEGANWGLVAASAAQVDQPSLMEGGIGREPGSSLNLHVRLQSPMPGPS